MARQKRPRRSNDTMIGVHPAEEAAIMLALRESLKTTCQRTESAQRLMEARANAISTGLALELIDYEVLQTIAAKKTKRGRKPKNKQTPVRDEVSFRKQRKPVRIDRESLSDVGSDGDEYSMHSCLRTVGSSSEGKSVLPKPKPRQNGKATRTTSSEEHRKQLASVQQYALNEIVVLSSDSDEDIAECYLSEDFFAAEDDNKDDSDFEPDKKRKCSTVKNSKAHVGSSPRLAQRKFANNVESRSSTCTPVKTLPLPLSTQSSVDSVDITSNIVSTSDFINFLCLRGLDRKSLPKKYHMFEEQTTAQSTEQSTEQSTAQSTEQSTVQSTVQSTEQSTAQSTEQSTEQSTAAETS